MKLILPLILVVAGAVTWALWPGSKNPAKDKPKADTTAAKDNQAKPKKAPEPDPTPADPRTAVNQAESKGDPTPVDGPKPNLDAPKPPPPTPAEIAARKAEFAQPSNPMLKPGESGIPADGYRTFKLPPLKPGQTRTNMNRVGRAALLADIKSYRDNLPASGQLPRAIKAADVLSEDVMHDLNIGPNDVLREIGDSMVDDREGYNRLVLRLEEPAQHIVGLTVVKPDGREVRDYVDVMPEEGDEQP
ncbi:MAG: hypothetical protein ACE366_15125 [Bradymonadia bacterium]